MFSEKTNKFPNQTNITIKVTRLFMHITQCQTHPHLNALLVTQLIFKFMRSPHHFPLCN